MKFKHKKIFEIEVLDKQEDFKYCVWLNIGYVHKTEQLTLWHCNSLKEIKEFLKDVIKI